MSSQTKDICLTTESNDGNSNAELSLTEFCLEMLVVMILRRIAYNLLSLFICVTQRADDKRKMAWKSLMNCFFLMLVKLEEHNLVASSRLAKSFCVV